MRRVGARQRLTGHTAMRLIHSSIRARRIRVSIHQHREQEDGATDVDSRYITIAYYT